VDLFLLRLHQRQVAHQCSAALQAFHMGNLGLVTNDQDIFWASIQNMLTAVANISKACWGQGGKLAEERRPLRESLRIADDSPLANTDLRNHLEHYDERLDRWYETSENKNHADFLIGPAGRMVAGRGIGDKDVFRHFDPATGDVVFWGVHYSIPVLLNAIAALKPIAEAEARKPHWQPPPMQSGNRQ
jgi:hypothetical protein